jgi:hypothetical protein
MQTQKAAQLPTSRFLLPPLKLEFEISQEHRNRCFIHARVYSGNHCFLHRGVEVFYDQFDEIPVIMLDAEMRWLFWLAQFEAERRTVAPGQLHQFRLACPDWPSLDLSVRQDDGVS